jgi:hypothetical protein
MASIRDRLMRLESRRKPPSAPMPPQEVDEFVRAMNAERSRIEAADREALGHNPDFDFGDDPPEPEPPREEADEPDEGGLEGEDWYLNMLLDLRAGAGDDVSPTKLEAIDRAIEHERNELRRERHEGST